MIFTRVNKSISSRTKVVLAILLLNVLIVACFWSVLGKNYTPVNDAWVQISAFDTNFPELEEDYELGSRFVRKVPFILASHLEEVGFTTLNTFLILINILTGVGIFLIVDRFFPHKTLFCAISSLLIMYFPYDGTMFWLGAFGVNLGYLLGIYSLYFFICSVDDSSKVKFWVAILLLLAGGKTYPGWFPVHALVLALYLFSRKKSWRTWWTRAGLFFFIWAIGFIQFALNAISGEGREGRVANFDLTEVLNGFGYANRHLFVEAWGKLLEIDPAHWGKGIVVMFAAISAFYWICQLVADTDGMDKEGSKSYKKIVLGLVVVAPLILVAGYVPYAASDIRYGTDRQLLFARPGVVLLYMAALFWLVFSIVRPGRVANMVIIVVLGIIIGLSVQAKIQQTTEYAAASQNERIFLGDFAEAIPAITGSPSILIYFDDESVIVNNQAMMLVNRPQYLVGYLLERYDIAVYGANEFLLKKYEKTYRDGALLIKGRQVPIQNLLVFAYDLKKGIRFLDNLTIPVGKNEEKVVQLLSPKIVNKPLTARQRWFVDERDRLVKLLDLR